MDPKPRKLLDQVRDCLRLKQYAHRTEETYILWIRQYILFHNKRHPVEMGRIEVEAFLTHLAVEKKVAASTQNQALSAILFLYQHIFKIELTDIDAVRARQSRNLPTVLTPQEVYQTRQLPYLPPLLRHPPPPKRLRHPHHPRTPRPQRSQNHHDLHTHVLNRGGRGVISPSTHKFSKPLNTA